MLQSRYQRDLGKLETLNLESTCKKKPLPLFWPACISQPHTEFMNVNPPQLYLYGFL